MMKTKSHDSAFYQIAVSFSIVYFRAFIRRQIILELLTRHQKNTFYLSASFYLLQNVLHSLCAFLNEVFHNHTAVLLYSHKRLSMIKKTPRKMRTPQRLRRISPESHTLFHICHRRAKAASTA